MLNNKKNIFCKPGSVLKNRRLWILLPALFMFFIWAFAIFTLPEEYSEDYVKTIQNAGVDYSQKNSIPSFLEGAPEWFFKTDYNQLLGDLTIKEWVKQFVVSGDYIQLVKRIDQWASEHSNIKFSNQADFVINLSALTFKSYVVRIFIREASDKILSDSEITLDNKIRYITSFYRFLQAASVEYEVEYPLRLSSIFVTMLRDRLKLVEKLADHIEKNNVDFFNASEREQMTKLLSAISLEYTLDEIFELEHRSLSSFHNSFYDTYGSILIKYIDESELLKPGYKNRIVYYMNNRSNFYLENQLKVRKQMLKKDIKFFGENRKRYYTEKDYDAEAIPASNLATAKFVAKSIVATLWPWLLANSIAELAASHVISIFSFDIEEVFESYQGIIDQKARFKVLL